MNIKQAKKEIKRTINAYLWKDSLGEYRIDTVRQRPVLLIGPPGIGKTAIMEQIAQELGIGLVAYSMTHHTRQSAIGLPYIERRRFDEVEYAISEYTMSEIIASVYEQIQRTGIREGILFLDEINCVSETLAPAMLQLLQYKTFAKHQVPDGWIIVTAGNPPEYNKSVREFDVVTLDRVKKIVVEPDLDVWKEYAQEKKLHGSILSYLDVRQKDFYMVETTVDGKSFVTARGWEDLSDMIRLFEEMEEKVDEDLVIQYLQNEEVAREFAIYYDLYNKYKVDYKIQDILAGKVTEKIRTRARAAKFDERITLIGLLLDACYEMIDQALKQEALVTELLASLRQVKAKCLAIHDPDETVQQILEQHLYQETEDLLRQQESGILKKEDKRRWKQKLAIMQEYMALIKQEGFVDRREGFAYIKERYDGFVSKMKEYQQQTGEALDNMILFAEQTFGTGQELLLMVTELTANTRSATFIRRHGCQKYFEHNQELLLQERHQQLMQQIDLLEKREEAWDDEI